METILKYYRPPFKVGPRCNIYDKYNRMVIDTDKCFWRVRDQEEDGYVVESEMANMAKEICNVLNEAAERYHLPYEY